MAHYDCSGCGSEYGISPEICGCDNSAKYPKVNTTNEHTGGSSSYYRVRVSHPTTIKNPYEAECNDIIESLKMTFAEANVFKALWRNSAARMGKQKVGNNGVYDAEKMVFFSNRVLIQEKESSN